jgi:DNA-binding response OmpR family regulator
MRQTPTPGGERGTITNPKPPAPPQGRPGGQVTALGVEIDPDRRRVRVEGRDVDLTDQEFRLLQLLAANPGIVFSRDALLAKIWRGDTFVTVRSVDTLVKRVRRRIEPDPRVPRFLLTVWGVGYKFADA